MPSILVCGDIMLDQNIYVKVEKLANEAPIPVFGYQREEAALGGCGNVVKNLKGILNSSDRLHLVSAIGEDDAGRTISAIVDQLGVQNHLLSVKGYTTTVKRRYFCDNKIMFRCDTEVKLAEQTFACIEEILRTESIDCIILSDYNKGVLTWNVCQDIIRLATAHGVFTCVDPKQDYTKYKGCTVIKPNKKEAYSLLGLEPKTPLLTLHKRMVELVGCKYSVITLAENGSTLYDGKTMLHERPLVRKIIDVTGAGDVVCAVLAYFLSSGGDPQTVLKMATRIATKSVEYPGTYTLSAADLITSKCVKSGEIPKQGTIVFTNGCFDLLHSGHIGLFKFCKELGTVVVGVNSDESVRRLKGATRPVNSLQTRLDVLEAIQYIDWIVVFEEDTPVRVLDELRPDLLVKGGDYTVDTVLGKEFAGETLIYSYMEGHSSTGIIKKIRS